MTVEGGGYEGREERERKNFVCSFKLEGAGHRIVDSVYLFSLHNNFLNLFSHINVNIGFSKLISKMVI